MRVLFQTRASIKTVPGGDTIQLERTARYLRLKGVDVEIDVARNEDVRTFDLVHLFNLTRPQDLFVLAKRAKAAAKPVVLSTIYVDYSEYEREARGGLLGQVNKVLSPWQVERLKTAARAVVGGEWSVGSARVALQGYRSMCNQVLGMTDLLLPNSESELTRICRDFPSAAGRPYVVVPNAVDTAVFDRDATEVSGESRKFAGCVLSVGRIEGRKCQLQLVRAMKELPYQLLLIGKPAPNHRSYYEAVKRESGGKAHILGHVDHEELPKYYKAARVHALVSWMETTGLSSLEAGAMGCNLVITAKGDTREYFGDDAFYCEPDSVASIRDAILRAYAAPPSDQLRRRITSQFNWSVTAEKTLQGYELALDMAKAGAAHSQGP